MIIDIMRTSASRPDYLKISTESMLKHLKFSGGFRWIIHEDTIDKELSSEIMDYIKGCGVYNVIERHDPPLGQGASLTWLMNTVNSKYVINYEDDWELLKDIDIDQLIDLMDTHISVNQIAFFKRPIMNERHGFKKKQVYIDDIPLVVAPHWAFTPSIFRLSYLKPKWVTFNTNPHFNMQHILKKRTKEEDKAGTYFRDADWMEKHVGNYFLGCIKSRTMWEAHGGPLNREDYEKIDNGHYVYHLGQHKHGKGGSVRLGSYKKEN